MMIRSMGAGEGFIPQSLMLKVLAEPDEKGFYHYLLAQALLSHLQHNQIDTNVLIDVDWENTILSQFGPQVASLHSCMLHSRACISGGDSCTQRPCAAGGSVPTFPACARGNNSDIRIKDMSYCNSHSLFSDCSIFHLQPVSQKL